MNTDITGKSSSVDCRPQLSDEDMMTKGVQELLGETTDATQRVYVVHYYQEDGSRLESTIVYEQVGIVVYEFSLCELADQEISDEETLSIRKWLQSGLGLGLGLGCDSDEETLSIRKWLRSALMALLGPFYCSEITKRSQQFKPRSKVNKLT